MITLYKYKSSADGFSVFAIVNNEESWYTHTDDLSEFFKPYPVAHLSNYAQLKHDLLNYYEAIGTYDDEEIMRKHLKEEFPEEFI